MSRSRSRVKSAEGLTPRQIRFVELFLSEGETLGNAKECAKRAGYGSGDEGKWINGYQVLNNPAVQEAIANRISRRLASLEGDAIKSALARLARADMSNFITVEEIEIPPTAEELASNPDAKPKKRTYPFIDWAKARDAAALGQIREFRETAEGFIIKVHDPRPAIETLAKIAGLLKERVDVTSGDKPIQPEPQPFDHDRFAELYRQRTGGNRPGAGADSLNRN